MKRTFQPKTRQEKKEHGFMKRMKTKSNWQKPIAIKLYKLIKITMSKKGNILSVRPDLKIIDCTIRDGGLVNDFHFTDEFVQEVYKACLEAGIDYLEIGKISSRKLVGKIPPAKM